MSCSCWCCWWMTGAHPSSNASDTESWWSPGGIKGRMYKKKCTGDSLPNDTYPPLKAVSWSWVHTSKALWSVKVVSLYQNQWNKKIHFSHAHKVTRHFNSCVTETWKWDNVTFAVAWNGSCGEMAHWDSLYFVIKPLKCGLLKCSVTAAQEESESGLTDSLTVCL